MVYIVFFIGILAGFSAFLTHILLKAARKNDAQKLMLLQEEIESEKEQTQFYQREQKQFTDRKKRIDQKLLQIRLDLLNTEDDLNEVIPVLLQ